MALRSFREGDRVKVIILSVDLEKRRLSLGLKPSYFGEGDLQDDEDSEAEDAQPVSLGVVGEQSDDEGAAPEGGGEDEEEGNDEDDGDEAVGDHDDITDEDDAMDDIEVTDIQNGLFKRSLTAQQARGKESGQTLDLGSRFQWNADDDLDGDMVSDDESGDDEELQPPQPKKRKRKEIEQDLTADMHTKTPESNADFERLLLSSPSSSYLWIQYMSFQLQLSEVEKAREIARRALKIINFREEHEKLNVWLALLNLENVYGSEESLDATFKDAARHMDSKTIHLRMASIFEQSEKFEV